MLSMIKRRVPWLMVFEAARMAHGHLMEVTSPQDRAQLADMVRRTKGKPQALTAQDKAELRRMGGQLELLGFLKSAGPRLIIGRKLKRR
jgi:uncharacterized protein YbjT (DUF2867 family)